MTPLLLANQLLEDTYSYAGVLIELPPATGDFVIEWGKLNIPDSDIYVDESGEKGRERAPHVTVKYGLEGDMDTTRLEDIAAEVKPFPVVMGVVSLFTTNPKYDVVKISVESPQLHILNKMLSALPNADKYPDYSPHITVAYVKKGSSDHLNEEDPFKAEDIAREFVADGFTYFGSGDSEDPERQKETFQFRRAAREMTEAAVGPSLAQMSLILDEIKGAVADSNGDVSVFTALANEALKPHAVTFGKPPPAHDFGAPAVATEQGAFLRPPSRYDLNDPNWPYRIYGLLQHELVHVKQMSGMKDPAMVAQKATEWVTPNGYIDSDRYLQQKQEVMAWAASMVDSWRRQNISPDRMMELLRTGNWGMGSKYWAARKRYPKTFNSFVRYAHEYIDQLRESVEEAAISEGDPFDHLQFPVDPERLARFLRSKNGRTAGPTLL